MRKMWGILLSLFFLLSIFCISKKPFHGETTPLLTYVITTKMMPKAITEKDVSSAIRQYHELKATQPDAYDFGEQQLNSMGYQLLRMNKIPEAIEIFKLNAEVYPQSGNVYDSLGEAYMLNGDRELAIKNYEKSLELDPKNTNAAKMLKKLRAK